MQLVQKIYLCFATLTIIIHTQRHTYSCLLLRKMQLCCSCATYYITLYSIVVRFIFNIKKAYNYTVELKNLLFFKSFQNNTKKEHNFLFLFQLVKKINNPYSSSTALTQTRDSRVAFRSISLRRSTSLRRYKMKCIMLSYRESQISNEMRRHLESKSIIVFSYMLCMYNIDGC